MGRAKNIFTPKNINAITIVIIGRLQQKKTTNKHEIGQ